ncbi:hypothetical protein CSQ89_20510 [Chitinimonas sp. BJB300]|nr:hypothetical protein CSQ89_20510 [Chitinimonas sp. BJB300]
MLRINSVIGFSLRVRKGMRLLSLEQKKSRVKHVVHLKFGRNQEVLKRPIEILMVSNLLG